MGTTIKSVAEVRTDKGWRMNTAEVFDHPACDQEPDPRSHIERPFYWQSYGMFGFFAGVRNHSQSHVLAAPRGLPEDADDASVAYLAPHYQDPEGPFGLAVDHPPLTVAERVRQGSGERGSYSWLGAKELLQFDYDQVFADRSEQPPESTTYREFLGPQFFRHLDALAELGAPNDVRVLFCFE